MTDARTLHDEALVVDALVHHTDGWNGSLSEGGIDAINLTVCHFEADFPEACQQVAGRRRMMDEPGAKWMQIETIEDFDRAKAAGRTGVVMGWQNSRPIADQPDRLYFFRKLGLRIAQLTYNYRNMIGDGCLEPEGAGLTTYGLDVVKLMNELGIAIDLSHVGYRTTMDAIEASEKPVLVTHANASAVTDLERNKPDDLMRAVKERGGFFGASIYGPMCWDGDKSRRPTIDDYLRHLDHIVNVMGVENVGFGTDLATGADMDRINFERQTPRRWQGIEDFNAVFGQSIPERYLDGCSSHKDLWKVTEALLARGWTEDQVRGYLGGNFRRILGEIWG